MMRHVFFCTVGGIHSSSINQPACTSSQHKCIVFALRVLLRGLQTVDSTQDYYMAVGTVLLAVAVAVALVAFQQLDHRHPAVALMPKGCQGLQKVQGSFNVRTLYFGNL